MESPVLWDELFCKQRCDLIEMADELSDLDDAQISMFLISDAGKFFDYTSYSISTSDVIDRYQRTLGIDLWSEKMEEDLERLKETNTSLREQIGQRTGQCLDDLSYKELFKLEQDMLAAARLIRERKFKVLSNGIQIIKKKSRFAEHNRSFLIGELDRIYGSVDNGGVNNSEDYLTNGLFQQRNGPNQNDIAEGESCLTSNANVNQQNVDGNYDSAPTPTSIHNPSDEDVRI